MDLKHKKYELDVLCAVEHLQKVVKERVPMGEREEVLAEVIRELVMVEDNVQIPQFTYVGVIE